MVAQYIALTEITQRYAITVNLHFSSATF